MLSARWGLKHHVDRRIGGLEIPPVMIFNQYFVDRRIGGLEIIILSTDQISVVDRRIGGLEKN